MIAAVIGWLGVCQVKLKHRQIISSMKFVRYVKRFVLLNNGCWDKKDIHS